MTKALLCVGGPAAGRVVAHEGEEYTALSIGENLSLIPFQMTEMFVPPRSITVYQRQAFYADDVELEFWVPEGQSFLETMQLLAEGYRRGQLLRRRDKIEDLVEQARAEERERCADIARNQMSTFRGARSEGWNCAAEAIATAIEEIEDEQ